MALKQASYSSSSDASETRAVQYILRRLRCFDGLRCLSSLAKASRSNWVPVPESRAPSHRRGKLAPIRNAILSINPAMGPTMNHHHNLHHLLRLLLRSLPSKGTCCSIVTYKKRKSRLRLGGNRGEDATRSGYGYGYGYYCPLALASVLASSAAGRAMHV